MTLWFSEVQQRYFIIGDKVVDEATITTLQNLLDLIRQHCYIDTPYRAGVTYLFTKQHCQRLHLDTLAVLYQVFPKEELDKQLLILAKDNLVT